MYVDVHARGVQPDKQHAAREFIGCHKRSKRLLKGSRCGLALDIARVDEEILIVAVGARVVGASDIAFDRNALVFAVHLDQAGGKILTEYRPNGTHQAAVACRFQLDVAVNDQAERDFGVGERNFLHIRGHRHCLGHVTLQEFATRGHVGKQILGNHGRAHGTAALHNVHDLAAMHIHLCAKRGVRRFGHDAQARHRSDCRKCFTTESQRTNAIQILRLGNLTGRVSADRHGKILGRHAVPVIGHAHKGHATVLYFHGNA